MAFLTQRILQSAFRRSATIRAAQVRAEVLTELIGEVSSHLLAKEQRAGVVREGVESIATAVEYALAHGEQIDGFRFLRPGALALSGAFGLRRCGIQFSRHVCQAAAEAR